MDRTTQPPTRWIHFEAHEFQNLQDDLKILRLDVYTLQLNFAVFQNRTAQEEEQTIVKLKVQSVG
jgi:hypothetical protein